MLSFKSITIYIRFYIIVIYCYLLLYNFLTINIEKKLIYINK